MGEIVHGSEKIIEAFDRLGWMLLEGTRFDWSKQYDPVFEVEKNTPYLVVPKTPSYNGEVIAGAIVETRRQLAFPALHSTNGCVVIDSLSFDNNGIKVEVDEQRSENPLFTRLATTHLASAVGQRFHPNYQLEVDFSQEIHQTLSDIGFSLCMMVADMDNYVESDARKYDPVVGDTLWTGRRYVPFPNRKTLSGQDNATLFAKLIREQKAYSLDFACGTHPFHHLEFRQRGMYLGDQKGRILVPFNGAASVLKNMDYPGKKFEVEVMGDVDEALQELTRQGMFVVPRVMYET